MELWRCGAVELWSCGAVELWTGDRSSQVVAGASAIFLEKTASAPVHARQARVVHQEVNVRAPGRGGGGGRGTKRR